MSTLNFLLILSSPFIILAIIAFIIKWRNFKSKALVVTRCIICGKLLNTSKLTTCSPQCNTIAQSTAFNFTQRLRSNVSRQKHISGFELSYYEWLDTIQYFNSNCCYCSKHLNSNSVVMDHFLPVSIGGLFTFKNILPACQSCNLTKSNSNPFQFLNLLPLNNKKHVVNFITNR